jgi:hypothetical protein
MLSSIFISALLAGPVVAGVIPRQNTVTVKHTVTSVIATSTVLEYAPSGKPAAFSYAPSPSPSASASAALPLAILNGFAENAAGFGLNPINGLPAAPPQKPSSASSTAPLVFHTYTSSKGAPAPIATNSPKSTKSAAASSSSPTLTRLIQTSSAPAHALPSAYSSLPQAPPQFPSVVISKIPVHETSTVASSSKPTTTSSKAPAPAPPAPTETQTKTEDDDAIPSDLAALFSSTEEATNPYPYPTETAKPKEPKTSNYTYPYPPKE